MPTHTTLGSLFTDIANAIRSKTGGSATIVADNFPTAISNIPVGSGNAQPSDVITGKTFANDNGQQTGTMANGSAKTPATTKAQSTPSISVSSGGLITASVAATSVSVTPTVSAGYISAGTAGTITMSASSNTKQLSAKSATTYNVSSSNQTIASGYYLTGTQTIRGVTTSNLSAGNIKSGVVVKVGDAGSAGRIASVTGTYTGPTIQTKTYTPTKSVAAGETGTWTVTCSGLTTVYGVTSLRRTSGNYINNFLCVCTLNSDTNEGITISGNTVTFRYYNAVDVGQTVGISISVKGV